MPMKGEEQFTTKCGVSPLLIGHTWSCLADLSSAIQYRDEIKMLYSHSQNLNTWLQAVDALMDILVSDACLVSCRNVSFCGFQ